ncbi:uncharacterized protein IUM83_10812 [Phytophthora cinnamomi]|uniref:uncharacterized protein n=1 Tax=Phytophthora cinnamomi TaxID=4785 RepID=UPI00355AA366|nr:hypothetical protein IUM83_10812 [Phytophthora cinnamomi]
MEMASSVMRFALATYFMKRGGSSHCSSKPDLSSWSSQSLEPSMAPSDFSGDEEDGEDVDPDFHCLVSTHVSNLRQLLVQQRFREWSNDIAELREYVADQQLLGSLVAVLVTMIRTQEQDAVCIVQGRQIRD